jgi:hypothetical protein
MFGFSWSQILYAFVIFVMMLIISFYKTNAKFRGFIASLINEAQSLDKTNSERKQWVVDEVYKIIPLWLKPILTKTVIGMVVQGIYDSIKSFALKKAKDLVKYLPDIGTVNTDSQGTSNAEQKVDNNTAANPPSDTVSKEVTGAASDATLTTGSPE